MREGNVGQNKRDEVVTQVLGLQDLTLAYQTTYLGYTWRRSINK